MLKDREGHLVAPDAVALQPPTLSVERVERDGQLLGVGLEEQGGIVEAPGSRGPAVSPVSRRIPPLDAGASP